MKHFPILESNFYPAALRMITLIKQFPLAVFLITFKSLHKEQSLEVYRLYQNWFSAGCHIVKEMEIRVGWIEILYIAFEKSAIYEVRNDLDRLQLSPADYFKLYDV